MSTENRLYPTKIHKPFFISIQLYSLYSETHLTENELVYFEKNGVCKQLHDKDNVIIS